MGLAVKPLCFIISCNPESMRYSVCKAFSKNKEMDARKRSSDDTQATLKTSAPGLSENTVWWLESCIGFGAMKMGLSMKHFKISG